MSYIGIPWDEQKTVRGRMRTVVSQFLRNFSNASEDDWEVFFRESERHLRRFAKYTVRYNDLPRAEEIYHQLVADLKDKFALSEERTYDSFRAVLYEFFRGRLIDDMRRSATVTKHSGGVEQHYRMLHRREESPFADDGDDYGDTDFVGMCRGVKVPGTNDTTWRENSRSVAKAARISPSPSGEPEGMPRGEAEPRSGRYAGCGLPGVR